MSAEEVCTFFYKFEIPQWLSRGFLSLPRMRLPLYSLLEGTRLYWTLNPALLSHLKRLLT